jgi:hypothetical protein
MLRNFANVPILSSNGSTYFSRPTCMANAQRVGPKTGRTKAKDDASTANVKLIGVTCFSREIKELPVIAV